MKKFNKIVILLLSFVGLFACERPIVPEDDPSVDVEMPKYGYIFFNLARKIFNSQYKFLHYFLEFFEKSIAFL